MARVLAFMWPGQENWSVYRPIQRLLDRLGVEAAIGTFGQHYAAEAEDAKIPRFALFDREENEIPRTSSTQYARAGGPELDFAASAAYYHLVGGFSDDPGWLFDDGPYYQRLRTVALRTKHIVGMYRPDVAIIGHGANPLPAVVARVCRELKLPVSYFESSFFPGRILLDSEGMHFFPGLNRIDKHWRAGGDRFAGPDSGRLAEFVGRWKDARLSKYAQPEDAEETSKAEEFAEKARRENRPVFFLPEQIPWDASVLLGLDRFPGWEDFLRHIGKSLPEGARVLVKRHPKRRDASDYGEIFGDRALTVSRMNIHRAIETSDGVITFSSNVGFEALLLGKPVYCGGSPHYARKGFTIDLDGTAADAGRLASLEGGIEWASFRRYAEHVIFEYLIGDDSPQELAGRLAESKAGIAWEEVYPQACRAYLSRVRAFSSERRKNRILAPAPEMRRRELLEALAPWRTGAAQCLDLSVWGALPEGSAEFDEVVLPGALGMAGDPWLLLRQAWGLLRSGGRLLVAERHPDLNFLHGEDVSLLDPSLVAEQLRQLPCSEDVEVAGLGPGGRPDGELWRPIYMARTTKGAA